MEKSHRAWNKCHPDDTMPEDGYVIHHKDENHNNDTPDNLQKMTDSEHKSHHHKGKALSEKQIQQISISNTGRRPWLGKHHTEESKQRMSVAQKGKQAGIHNSFYGKTHSKEARLKMSEKRKLRITKQETRNKMSAARSGDKHPQYGKPLSQTVKDKITVALTGKKLSEETKQKMRDAWARRKAILLNTYIGDQ